MKILHVISSVDPRGGGPRQGVLQYGRCLPPLGHSLEVVSLDDPAADFVKEFPLPVHALGPSRLGKYSFNPRLVPWLRAHARKYDAVVINGLWQYHSFGGWRALRGMGVPYFVFTHGMLDPWFKRNYPLKHLKKWLYWTWAEYRVLRDAKAVLFTSEEERLVSRQSFWLYQVHEAVVSYGASSPPADAAGLREAFLAAHPALRGKRLLLFLSRIHEKKGCDLLVQAFAETARHQPEVHLVVAGPDQTGWVPSLRAQARSLGVDDRISWPGMLQGDLKWGAFYASEAFVLPSHQENFGIAVAEALSCGLPVLISDKVNIWREIEADGAGLVAPDTLQGTRSSLNVWFGLTVDAKMTFVQRAQDCFQRRFTVDAMTISLLNAMQRA
jgi:glycosyltransferase involved in cell wall biosynthesis